MVPELPLHPHTPPFPLVCVGLASEGDGQGQAEVLDWLEEVEEVGSDWLNGFFTFLYGLINPLEDGDECGITGGVMKAHEEEDDDEVEDKIRQRGDKDDGSRGQKIVIVGLHNQ